MEYTKVEFTDEQRKELIRLMVGLTFVELKTKFDMNTFSQKHNGSYLDIEPGFKLGTQEVGGRWYLYMGHLWFELSTTPVAALGARLQAAGACCQ